MPLHAAPNARRRKVALGVPLTRVLQKSGLRVLNIQYHSRDLAEVYLRRAEHPMQIRWAEEDLGSIEVLFEDGWQTVPAVHDTFKGVHASIWLRTMRSLCTVDPKRKEWEEDVIFKAIRDIEAMNAQAKLSFGMLDHSWTPESVKQAEEDALMSFQTVPTRQKTTAASDGHGLAVKPVVPDDHDVSTPVVDPDRHRARTPRKPARPAAVTAPHASTTNTTRPGQPPPATRPADPQPVSRLGLQFPSTKPNHGDPT